MQTRDSRLHLLPQLTVKSILGRNNWCEVCEKTVVNFRRHMRDVHNNTEVQCEVCQKVFKNDSSCKKHMRVLHNMYQFNHWYLCLIKCGVLVNLFLRPVWQALRHLHLQDSTTVGIDQFLAGSVYCGNCNKHIDAKHFARHTRDVHGTNNHVKCPMCQKIFKNDSSCQKHLRVIHNVYRS